MEASAALSTPADLPRCADAFTGAGHARRTDHRRSIEMKRALAITTMAVGVAIGATAVGVASAVTPDSTGTIHTCYDNTTGGLRVSDPGNGPPACANTETPLSWQSGDLPHDV